MKRIATIIFALTFLMTAVSISSCKRKKEDATPNDGMVNETNEAESQWNDILKISEDAITAQGEASGVRTSADPTITKETISEGNFIGKITVNFGTATVGNDGRTRSGQIIVKYTGKYRTTGTVIQSTTQNYFVNGKEIRGVRTVTNNGSNSYYVVDAGLSGAEYAQIIYPNGGGTTSWKSTRDRVWTAGSGTIGTLSDDVYSITGQASGISKGGKAYDMTITNLVVKLECFLTYYIYMPSGGTIDITTAEGTRSVNYGNGVSCDRNVIYTAIDGKTYELSL